ncbi:cobalamin trafficking protein CblD-like [Amphibalanus amphitrite]|uniref:cobalamin trafficking protein CblD-like n=1 Tax=Amphibalanus amphitrite TaxID=1232801 RepID=UPI001C924F7A|nr:cobalamin trafficking protein CblD-like [Amphibalanus amphitrite]XP_043190052.1 cobalamin trafficking protein CblD-like [Amphibalanus amphitrite]XP_043190053.1 cobalamin trafficking protein CblD-like [Amphibalanus amphitrite]XP_043190054.1 cobalamin trafficking protein CblD-like [Amphibalanus amphitrite]
MALRLLGPGRRGAVLYRTLRQISAALRPLSTKDDVTHDAETVVEVRPLRPTVAAELLGDTDRRLPLPGGRGLAEELSPPLPPPTPQRPAERRGRVRNDTAAELLHDRHMATLFTYLSPMPGEPAPSEVTPVQPVLLEIQAHDCPQLLKEEFRPLFRERDIAAGRLTVLVVSQRTDQDMATWSEQVEQERLELASQFVSVGRDIVLGLRRRGFWADLVDPTTGRPHLGELAPAADADDRLIETDDRLGRLGFEIDDLGCCKVIRHAVWGSHVFIGCLFTDAPLDDPRLSDVLAQYQEPTPASQS